MGVVDGGSAHMGHSYNAALARRGYRIRFYDADGTLPARSAPRSRRSATASSWPISVDGVILGTSLYPLRLMGPAKYVPARKRMGRIVKIKMLPW